MLWPYWMKLLSDMVKYESSIVRLQLNFIANRIIIYNNSQKWVYQNFDTMITSWKCICMTTFFNDRIWLLKHDLLPLLLAINAFDCTVVIKIQVTMYTNKLSLVDRFCIGLLQMYIANHLTCHVNATWILDMWTFCQQRIGRIFQIVGKFKPDSLSLYVKYVPCWS